MCLAFPEAETETYLNSFDATLFYDIDASSRLLEIDYVAGEGRTIADLRTLISERIPCNAMCYYVPRDKCVVLLLFGEKKEDVTVKRVDLAKKEVCQAELGADVARDFVAFPVSRDNILFATEGYGVFATNFKAGKLDPLPLHLTSHTSFDVSKDGKVAYLFPWRMDPRGDAFRVLDLSNDKLVEDGLLREHVSNLGKEDKVAFTSFSEPYVLVSIWDKVMGGSKELKLLDCRTWKEVISLKGCPPFACTTCISLENPSSMIITRVGRQRNPKGGSGESGEIRRHRVNLSSSEEESLPEQKYNPAEEIVLKDASGNLRVFPRYRFDYVSYRDVSVVQESRTPLYPPSSEEEYVRLTGELAEKFSKRVETKEKIKYGEYLYTVKHLTIKAK